MFKKGKLFKFLKQSLFKESVSNPILLSANSPINYLEELFTDVNEAINLAKERKSDKKLQKEILNYLSNDLPEYFAGDKPTLYLSRHVATPNLETLKFIEVAKPHNLPIVIGEDRKGKFVSINADKRSLGKMQIIKGINRWEDEILENFTIIDFKKCEGVKFNDIKTINNECLVDFHHNLFHEIYPDLVKIHDESKWIDRNYRNNILEQYKRFLTLMISGGIMFEVYYPDDKDFIEEIILPAFEFVKNKFGVKPLICKIFTDSQQNNEQDWIKYPSVIYQYVNQYTQYSK